MDKTSNLPAEDSPHALLQIARNIGLWVAFALAVTAIFNSMPSVWIIPKIGPFKAEYLRGFVLLACVFVVLATGGFTRGVVEGGRSGKNRTHVIFALCVDILLLLVTALVAYYYITVNLEIEESLFFFEPHHAWVTVAAVVVLIILCWLVWGMPLALFGVIAFAYYFSGQYWPGILKIIPMSFIDSFPEDMLFNLGNGIMGFIFETIIYTVFPFIVFGALLEATGIGTSLIRLAFRLTASTRGGPAHAAVLASSLFGTMSGVPVANVVGTGVLTIPMIKRRGFSPSFAGGIEATASTGGQIVPPIMGAAAIVMADQLKVSYLVVITAALLPALFYYMSLFMTVTFEARRLGIKSGAESSDTGTLTKHDAVNLFVLAGAIAVIVSTLLYGLSAAAAGVFATLYMIPACFLSATVRENPLRMLFGIASGGLQFSRLVMAIGVVGVVLAVLSSTGLPVKLAIIVDAAMGQSLLFALIITGLTALVFGMGMPTLPAYLTIILILGPSLIKLGMSLIVAHMFVFYFGVSSAITPPVAIAAYAAASIAGAGPLRTGLTAFRIGLAMFMVPFAFAFYPELLLTAEAGGFAWDSLIWICLRLTLSLWLLTSAFSRYDFLSLGGVEIGLRLVLAIALLVVDPVVHFVAFFIGVGLITRGYLRVRRDSVAIVSGVK